MRRLTAWPRALDWYSGPNYYPSTALMIDALTGILRAGDNSPSSSAHTHVRLPRYTIQNGSILFRPPLHLHGLHVLLSKFAAAENQQSQLQTATSPRRGTSVVHIAPLADQPKGAFVMDVDNRVGRILLCLSRSR